MANIFCGGSFCDGCHHVGIIRILAGERGAFDNSETMAMMKRGGLLQTFTIQSLEYVGQPSILSNQSF